MSERGTGRTTRQLMALPLRSLYVVEHYRDKEHTERLAKHLGRSDIRVITPLNGFEETRGMEWAAFDIDHDCRLSDREEQRFRAMVLPMVRLEKVPYVAPAVKDAQWGAMIDDVGSGA